MPISSEVDEKKNNENTIYGKYHRKLKDTGKSFGIVLILCVAKKTNIVYGWMDATPRNQQDIYVLKKKRHTHREREMVASMEHILISKWKCQ